MAQSNATSVGTQSRSEERSLSELLQQLTEQTTRLAQKETELAKAEMTAKGKRLGMGAGAFSAAGLLGLAHRERGTAHQVGGRAAVLREETPATKNRANPLPAVVVAGLGALLGFARKFRVAAGM